MAIAGAVSFVRVIVIVAAIKASLLAIVAPALVAATVLAVGYAFFAAYRQEDSKAGKAMEFENPFSFWPVVGFAIFLGPVMMVGRAVGEAFGSNGAQLGAIGLGLGLADVDAVTISVARLVPQPLGAVAASTAILAAVASNTVAKLAMSLVIGRGRFASGVVIVTAICWLGAGAALWATLALAPT